MILVKNEGGGVKNPYAVTLNIIHTYTALGFFSLRS